MFPLTRSLKTLLAAATLALGLAAGPAAAQTRPAVRDLGADALTSALFIGNSFFYYNNSLHGHLGSLLASATPRQALRAVSITISASSFSWHDVDSYFRPNAVSSYSFTPDNKIVMNKFDRLFDVAIMMDCSQCPIHPQLSKFFTEYAAKNSAIARSHGAEPVFFMSWAYADKPEMTEQLAAAYLKAGADNRARVVPAGLAFARSIAKRPELNLYVADKRHPNLAGTYLAACTVMASVYGQSPVGNKYTAGLPADVAAHLQAVAWETVQGFRQP